MIETKVEGSPGSVRRAAEWLHDVADSCDVAADRAARARRAARSGWTGEAAEGYLLLNTALVSMSDDHSQRAPPAARTHESDAPQLRVTRNALTDNRARAQAGKYAEALAR